MRKILILTGRYLPGFKDGGPVRSILNLTEWFGDKYDIRILCLDRDHGDNEPYPNIKVNEFNDVGKAKVRYTQAFTAEEIKMLAEEADVVYCCGPYNDYSRIVMKLKRDGQFKAPLFVASMGSFSPEAFKIKGIKKKAFVTFMKMTGMFDKIIWSVTSKREEDELKSVVGKSAKCVIAEDLARRDFQKHTAVKQKDKLRIIFLSRISRKKNLIVVPDILSPIDDRYDITIDVFGVPEDREYLNECLAKFESLPSHIKWEYKGELASEEVPKVFAGYDAFLFPTLGENYGHVIAEALAAGCVPVISDTTPWLDFDERGCGYVCSLKNLMSFSKALNELAGLEDEEFSAISDKCLKYINEKNEISANSSGYSDIFEM